MKKKDKKTIEITLFKKGDWISTTEIEPNPGQKYTNAHVKKTKDGGKELFVTYGAYQDTKWVTAKSCTLIKRL